VTLKSWLESRGKDIAKRWILELRLSPENQSGGGEGLLEELVYYIVSFLPAFLGGCRERSLEILHHTAHLYGSLAVRRGLAAGEVVEELQLLRGVILRLYLLDFAPRTSQEGEGQFGSPMDFMALNRVLDRCVSRASVSYLDDLFFTHLQGSGVVEGITEALEKEILCQLEGFRDELGC
jgi:hypothetical protein